MVKKSLPLAKAYQLLEPGPVVMVSTFYQRQAQCYDHVMAYDDRFRAAAYWMRDQRPKLFVSTY